MANGAVTDLGTPGGTGRATQLDSLWINDTGQIAGSVFNGATETTEGFLYGNGSITSPGGFLPTAINDNGVIAGAASIDTGGTAQNLNTGGGSVVTAGAFPPGLFAGSRDSWVG